ncbi:uncharacterized protein LOC131875248 [Cryptomeria japonica]|uniref:uncharacterized protein LOC131875248 n=1 Tax=Cryptomeria japonica TaxID=3369 RepID=UPI0027DA4367|nr:uncharacterized protein LOC131875248 [Cryptomeria japonica]
MDQTGYVCKGMNRTFFEAAKSGNVRALNEISPPWSVANEVTPGGNTVLHIAAYHGSLPFVHKLLQLSNANLEDGMTFLKAKNMEGNTALHEAALGGSEQVVNTLLEFCPDLVNEINKASETALFKACEGVKISTFEGTLRWNSNLISVSAVLIATVAFAAAFTLPGGTGNQARGPPAPILININLFKLFVIFDTLAFCFSIASAILLNFAGFRSHVEDWIITQFSLEALYIAVLSLSITFGAAIHLVVASKCLWLAVSVWVMVCLLPICIRAMSLFGKAYLFIPRGHYVFILLEGFGLAYNMLFPLIWVVSVVFFYPIVRLSLSRVLKKLYGIKSLEEVRYNGVRSLAEAPRNNRQISSLELRFWRILFRYVISQNA